MENETETDRQTFLMAHHLRQNGDRLRHMCSICMKYLVYRDITPDWSQCPICKNVIHEACFRKLVQVSNDVLKCPSCMTEFPLEDYVTQPSFWSAHEALDAIISEKDNEFICMSSSQMPTVASKRKLRSSGPVCDERRMRSRTISIPTQL